MSDTVNTKITEDNDTARNIICGANAYDQKYYFNKEMYGNIPQSIQEELHVICVLFTEECGGIFTIRFEEDGGIAMDTISEETDYLYDEVSAGLLMGEIRRKRQELFESLSMYYKVFVLHEPLTDVEENEDE